ncbi:MAG: GntR domain protein [Devosia sp.]|uniref:FadR/GntR family transcriptional regulator n=1 Tax=Devosia sp. TaxID=1871048 RepID=UPI0026344DB2|nr:FadR/GntR family transcriptional regulator [Devosia sp.]MDB5539704.1 GntR domain protein [Devosia sp.]
MPNIQIQPAPNRRLADILYGQLLEQIMQGVLVRGQQLPTENALCEAFGASRPIVREALMRLKADGLVEARRGSGTYLIHTPSPNVTRFVAPADFASYLRAFEVRNVIEPVAAGYAAERRTAEDLARIEEAADIFGAAAEAGGGGLSFDISFHRAIAAATGNEFFVRQLEVVGAEVAGFISVALGLTRLGSAERKSAVLLEHRQIVEAIEMGDAELASVYMRYHLNQARRRLTDATRQP